MMKLNYLLSFLLFFSIVNGLNSTHQDSLEVRQTENQTSNLNIEDSGEAAPQKEPGWKSLSLRQKIAQMIMIRMRGDFYNEDNWFWKDMRWTISNLGIGG
ncbi:MAG: hypothetical protein ACE5D7_04975, partial [Fidelibacterota bacterium]